MDLVKSTLTEVGLESLEGLNRFVFIRLDKEPEKTASGLLVLPEKQKFWSGKGAEVILSGVVLAKGPDCKQVAVGNKVLFRRFELAWWKKLGDFTYIGMIDETFLIAKDTV